MIMAMVLAVFYGCGSQADKVQDTAEDIGRILTADADEMDAQEGLADEPIVLDFVDA